MPEPAASSRGCVLGFDFGEKRIGVAIGEHLLGIAHPLVTIDAEANDKRFAAIAGLIEEWQPEMLVVGLPSYLNGDEHALTQLCRKFARRLEGRFNLPVQLVDERLSSAEASQTLKQSGISGRKQKSVLDQVAAQHILQSYFDGLAS
ncbi:MULTISPECIES: Holliday junction resolvase RuvX [Methylobacillus]|uniref:Putative pre-16S rRNA nuclease n=1 Tax=Methylobacillus flagellatus (strain ATCC 51484 / DSM 6875 / VKM B-1610 / KT) TaxID=265072 RepID=YQGF_METFK|nr:MULTISPECIES: Holliday junction resolvase RuvX [Methylobacillus]Q1GZH0.1 RecName: Full=Putative pre-16S rRNA nuclease [Methylobacillus flagellatus KT]ABE50367.1 Holliday junction resolvase YqgF [Methylobacillus flagellatus KT]MPS50007.1 Holliday junction resolvase RuvX [Methylobacillus sp.]